MKPPPGTSRGVIHGLPEDITQDQLVEYIATNQPYLIHARLMGRTRSALLTFNGTRVPYYVKFDCEMVRCRPYRRAIQTCKCCGELGHRQDVCPHLEQPHCPACGTPTPPPDHLCTPHCKLCDGPHQTAHKDCPKRFLPTPPRKPSRSNLPGTSNLPTSPRQEYPPLPLKSAATVTGKPPTAQSQVSWSDVTRVPPTARPSQPTANTQSIPPVSPALASAIAELKQQQQHFQSQLDSLTKKIEALVATPPPTPSPPPPPAVEELHTVIDARITTLIKELIDTQKETCASLHRPTGADRSTKQTRAGHP